MRSAARRSRRSRSWAAVSLATALAVGGCGMHQEALPTVRVAVVVLENHGPDEVLGDGWLGRVARAGGVAVNAYGEVHRSLGNYLARLSGSTQGVADDDISRGPFAAPSLAGQLARAGVPWRAYMD